MSQRVLSIEHVPQTEEEDFGGDEEDTFTRESREIGAEFVKLLIGEVGATSKGPGDGQQETAASPTDERSSGSRSASVVNVPVQGCTMCDCASEPSGDMYTACTQHVQ